MLSKTVRTFILSLLLMLLLSITPTDLTTFPPP
jgi:hypothetical protein